MQYEEANRNPAGVTIVEGDILFVLAGKQYRFVDFTPDPITWAIF